jgi:hypothetical protein
VQRHQITPTFLVIGSLQPANLVLAYEHPMHSTVIGPCERPNR